MKKNYSTSVYINNECMFRTGNLEGGRQNNFFKPALSEVFIGKVTNIIMKFDLKKQIFRDTTHYSD